VFSAEPVVTAACVFFCRRPWVRPAPGIPCASSSEGPIDLTNSDAMAPRERRLMGRNQGGAFCAKSEHPAWPPARTAPSDRASRSAARAGRISRPASPKRQPCSTEVHGGIPASLPPGVPIYQWCATPCRSIHLSIFQLTERKRAEMVRRLMATDRQATARPIRQPRAKVEHGGNFRCSRC
jgi:hypothetical protein